jgi:hypothetical protein
VGSTLELAPAAVREAFGALELGVAELLGVKDLLLGREDLTTESVVAGLGESDSTERADLLAAEFLPCLVDEEQHGLDPIRRRPQNDDNRTASLSACAGNTRPLLTA